MTQVARVKIRQLEERVATMGLHMGGPPERRKLMPGEVIEIPDDLMVSVGKGRRKKERALIDVLWDTGKLEMTRDRVNRPLEYDDVRQAEITSPTYKSHGPDEDEEMAEAFAEVEAMLNESRSAESDDDDGSPAADRTKIADRDMKARGGRRGRRQALAENTA